MLPDNPDDQARIFYLALLGMVIAAGLFGQYRRRLGQAAQHAAIWVLIFLGAVLIFSFKDNLSQALFIDDPHQLGDGTITLQRGRDGHFHVTALVNGKSVRFVIDTGATNLVLSQADAERVGIDPDALAYVMPTQTANGQVMSARVQLDSIALGPHFDEDIRATVNGGALRQSLMGMSYLSLYRSLRVEGDTMYLVR